MYRRGCLRFAVQILVAPVAMPPSFVSGAGQGGAHAGRVELPLLVERLCQPVRAAVQRGTVRVPAA
eukprot:693449-Pyramimonas_sp.AAC.1